MNKYIRKPEIVNAFQYVPGDKDMPSVLFREPNRYLGTTNNCPDCRLPYNQHRDLVQSAISNPWYPGLMVCPGDYVCIDEAGQVYRVRRKVFEFLYGSAL